MPTPVLEVAVDDTDFKEFVAIFQKYQEQLKTQPQAWQGVNQGISDSKASADEFAASMGILVDAVNKLTAAEENREQKRQRSEELKKRDAERKRREEEEEADRQRSVVNRVREYSRNVGEVVKKTGGNALGFAENAIGGITGGAAGIFGGIGSALKSIPVVGGVLGGLALAGYETMNVMGGTMRQAHGLGIDTGTLQAWRTSKLAGNLPEGSLDNLLNTVAEAKASPGGGGLFGRFGVNNYQNKNASEISAEMLIQAQKLIKAHPGDTGMWKAKALYGGALDTGTLNALQKISPKELNQYLSEIKQYAKEHKDADKTAVDSANSLAKAEQLATSAMDAFAGTSSSAVEQATDALKKLYEVIQPFLPSSYQKAWQDFKANVLGGPGSIKTDDGKPVTGSSFFGDAWKGLTNFAGNTVSDVGKFLAEGIGTIHSTSVADRNNNPGNIMSGGRYNQYGSREAGFTAMALQLQTDYNKHNAHTVAALINGPDHPWASERAPGNTHASTMNYIDKVSRSVGVGANQQINLNDPKMLAAVVKAMYEFESGHKADLPQSDTGHVGDKLAKALKDGTIKAHRSMSHSRHQLTVKTQSKPGSDVTVSARQLAGNN